MSLLCRDCFTLLEAREGRRCPACRSVRVLCHDEAATLSIAHVDCDAFYASIEKRDNPSIRDRPVIVGGGRRGVVAAACYVARTRGVKSAMPMFKALAACPDAVVITPDMKKYGKASRDVRRLMEETTPLVEPLSLDEAFLDLAGTEALHRAAPCQTLARLARRIEDEVGITVSVGLSFNKFLAKIASDLDKPRGFSMIGRAGALDFLATKPVSLIPGVGRALAQSLAREGIFTIADIRRRTARELAARFGAAGPWLSRLAIADDTRPVQPRQAARGISAETTLGSDVADAGTLAAILWDLCERVSHRAKDAGQGGRTIQLKLKTHDFRIITRRHALPQPTQLAGRLFEAGRRLLEEEARGRRYRLVGIGISDLVAADLCDGGDLLGDAAARRDEAERAMDKVRSRFGAGAIRKGRSLRED